MRDEAEATGCSHLNVGCGILSVVTTHGRWPRLWGCASSHTETDGLWCLLTSHSDRCNPTNHLAIPIFDHCQQNLQDHRMDQVGRDLTPQAGPSQSTSHSMVLEYL